MNLAVQLNVIEKYDTLLQDPNGCPAFVGYDSWLAVVVTVVTFTSKH
jgi:hypothetical protein